MPEVRQQLPELFHTGVIVDDIFAAIASYAGLGVTFTEVRDITLKVVVDGESRTERMLAAYTRQGPPYVELIQELDGDIWGPRALNLNHLGYWVEDVEQAARDLQAQGFVLRMVPDSSPPHFAYLLGHGSLWVELCGPSVRPMLRQWLMTCFEGPDAPPVRIQAGPDAESRSYAANVEGAAS